VRQQERRKGGNRFRPGDYAFTRFAKLLRSFCNFGGITAMQ